MPDLGFTCHSRKNGDVEIRHHGRSVSTLRGAEARKFLAAVEAGDPDERQRLMARVTGNYKRGNERAAGAHPRNRR